MSRFATRVIRLLEGVVAVLLLTIAVIVVTQVVLRYWFSSSITGANETITILFIYMSALGAAAAIGRGEHISITMGGEMLPLWLSRSLSAVAVMCVGGINAAMVGLSFGWIRITGHYLLPTTELPRSVVQLSVPVGCALAVVLCCCRLLAPYATVSSGTVSSGTVSSDIDQPASKGN